MLGWLQRQGGSGADGQGEKQGGGLSLYYKREILMRTLLCVALAVLLCRGVGAQVRQATPSDIAAEPALKEVPSPMLIDIPLGAGIAPNGKPRASLKESKSGAMRGYTDAPDLCATRPE
jgi:hypothetical protein